MKIQKVNWNVSIKVKLGNGDRRQTCPFFSLLLENATYIYVNSPMQNKYIQLPEKGERVEEESKSKTTNKNH